MRPFTRLAFTPIAFAALAALPAHAQTLSGFLDGDNLTVSSGGTHGTLGGSPFNNSTVSYATSTAPGAAVTINAGSFTLASGGTLSGGITADGIDVGLNPATTGGTGGGNVTITGGTITGFDGINTGGGTVTITGGNITGGTGAGAGLVAQVSTSNLGGVGGTINLYGTGFLVNNLPAPASLQGVGINTITGLVSGTLANGDKLATTYQLVGTGTSINFFAPAPEPSQFAALAVGILGLGALAIKAKKRTA